MNAITRNSICIHTHIPAHTYIDASFYLDTHFAKHPTHFYLKVHKLIEHSIPAGEVTWYMLCLYCEFVHVFIYYLFQSSLSKNLD